MWSKPLTFIACFLVLLSWVSAQDCTLSFSGKILDLEAGYALVGAEVRLVSSDLVTVTDADGNFELSNLCQDKYEVSVSYIGYASLGVNIILDHDSTVVYGLSSSGVQLQEASVTITKDNFTTEESSTISSIELKTARGADLASQLERTAGVNVLRTGTTSSKPIIHGAFGNRLTVMNHGLAQSGQQWGLDHAPEVDPHSGYGITVIKGVGALEYPGNSLGGIVLLKDAEIQTDSTLMTGIHSFYESNGRVYGSGLTLSRGSQKFKWRAQGNFSKSGDRSAPDYLLKNTGSERYSGALQFEINFSPRWKSSVYLSTFNSDIGVLRGSHIGNLTDLEEALSREEPFFTTDTFSYDIEAPYQSVSHHLARVSTSYKFSESQSIMLLYGFQFNQRKEFDIRRGERSDIPALSLDQFSNYLEAKHTVDLNRGLRIQSGLQLNRTDNTNLPETGILPLIPDYVSRELGVYSLLRKTWSKTQLTAGIRADWEERNVAAISNSVPSEILRFNNLYQNLSVSAGYRRELSENWVANYNIGLASRNPEVNELYSNGLHQGVSGVEEGDVNLSEERSLKQTLSFSGGIKNKLRVHLLGHYQHFSDYIFLNPTEDVRLTIRGAFPVFSYTQTNAAIYGTDVKVVYNWSENLSTNFIYSHLIGENIGEEIPLVFMPSNNLRVEIKCHKDLSGKWKAMNARLDASHVFRQNRLNPNQDFIAAPKSYTLLGAMVSVERTISSGVLQIYVKSDNLLNTIYRDYLNRQRYFTDDLGRNIVLGINLEF